MGWAEDISSWATKNNQESETVEGIAIDKGWESRKYKNSMRDTLFDFLDQWYNLSVKNLPIPATSDLKRNPIVVQPQVKKFTKLVNGWRVWTVQQNSNFSTFATDNYEDLEYEDVTLISSMRTHHYLVEKLNLYG